MEARADAAQCEAAVPQEYRSLAKAIVLDDCSVSEVARAVFGIPEVMRGGRLQLGEPSGHQRRIIEGRLRMALSLLHSAIAHRLQVVG